MASTTETYELFQYDSCPFCYRVRRFLDDVGLQVEQKDVLRDATARQELIQGGGRSTVPCLKITREDPEEVVWLYESLDIIGYLRQRGFGSDSQ